MNQKELYHFGIKGMKWGVRRYQNSDGTLTGIGRKRYERDLRERSGKKKGNKKPDPNRWVREDIERSKRAVDSVSRLTNNIKDFNEKSIRNKPKPKMDLSKMTDQEMRTKINRAMLERQYNDMFAPRNQSKGREYVSRFLEVSGDVLAIGSSALGIALAYKQLKG